MMTDWVVSRYVYPAQPPGQIWVSYENPSFPGNHFGRSVDTPDRNHMATDATPRYYYFGFTKTFSANLPDEIQQQLTAAWKDYFTV